MISYARCVSLSLSNISHNIAKPILLKNRLILKFLYVKLLVINCTLKSCCDGKYSDCFGFSKKYDYHKTVTKYRKDDP